MTPEEQACLVELAGMMCPTCGGRGGQEDGAGVCERCYGSGFLLDASVRVPCEHHEPTDRMPWGDEIRCLYCAGRGWTPTENYFVLEQALVKINLQVNHFAPGLTLVIGTVNGSRAISDMAEAVLEALARR